MGILKRQKENHKGYMEVLTTPHRYNLWTQVWDWNVRTQAFGGWTHWKWHSGLCWADEGWKGNTMDLGPKPSRRGCQLIVLVTQRGCVEDVSGSVRKTASWNQLMLLEQAAIVETNCSGEADGNRKELVPSSSCPFSLWHPLLAEPNRDPTSWQTRNRIGNFPTPQSGIFKRLGLEPIFQAVWTVASQLAQTTSTFSWASQEMVTLGGPAFSAEKGPFQVWGGLHVEPGRSVLATSVVES